MKICGFKFLKAFRMKIRKHLRFFIGNIIGFFIYHMASKKMKDLNNNEILSIYFHNPSVKNFERIIKYLHKESYTFISVKKLEQILVEKEPIDKKYVVLTFDDGWQSNILLVPIIEKYEVYSCFFISIDPIISGNFWWEYVRAVHTDTCYKVKKLEELKKVSNKERLEIIANLKQKISLKRSAMTKDELLEFAKCKFITIGSHSVNHPVTVNCNDLEIEYEYTESKIILEDWLKKEVHYFAYPNGNFNSVDIYCLNKANYRMAFTTKSEFINYESDLFQIPRNPCFEGGGFHENRAKIFGIWQKKITQ